MNMYLKNKKIFIVLFVFLIIFIFVIIIYLFISKKNDEKKYEIANNLESKFQTLTLYSSDNSLDTSRTNLSFSHIIGKIRINKISLNYPILSNCSEELLKISPCKLAGPSPNEIGNFCIAGHNYDNGSFFSNLSKLSKGDLIEIISLNNKSMHYAVYKKFEVKVNDTSVLSQSTNNKREVTLITCNNQNKLRLIIKAKEQ